MSTRPGEADLEQLLARRVKHIDAIRAAHPGLAEARLTRLADGTYSDEWRWESAEQMRAALGGMSRLGALAGAAWSLTGDRSAVDGEIVDER